ncbi:MAG: helix-turn-helix domain-containing protein [Thermoleophilaceae bacterium]|jgi:transposase|nr:helix-turn-helix domain-containing protein [Thermoleophilaceae bacterium]
MERETLEGYLAQGLSLEQIGAAVGRHPSTVSYWLKRYGLAATHHDKHAPRGGIDRETLEGFVARRMSLRTMARELDVTLATVSHWMAKFDLAEGAPRPVSPDRICVRVCRTHGETRFVLEGRGYYRCMQCRQERVVEWRRRKKLQLVEDAGGRCVLCGYDRFPRALHFHHVDPAIKSFALGERGCTRSIDRLRAEAKKCVLLCSNCHAEVEGGLTPCPLP